jgi:MFS family permease
VPRLRPLLARRFSPPGLGPAFARLWLASAVSTIGDGALLTAGPLLVASMTRRPAAVAAAVFAQALPWPLFALVSGAAVDRVSRRHLMAATDCCRGLALAVLTALVATAHARLWAVYAVLFVIGTGETLADTAASALVVTTVSPAALSRANARIYTTFTLGNQLLGPPVGALLFVLGAAWPLGLDAATFLLAAAIVVRMRPAAGAREDTAGPAPGRRVRDDIAEGIRWLVRTPVLRTLAVCILVMNVTFGAAFATWVLFARERLGVTRAEFGVLATAAAVGALAGPAVYRRLEVRAGVPALLRAGLVIETATHLFLAITRSAVVAGVTMTVFGVHAMVWGTASTTARQRATPPNMLGRVGSVYGLFSIGGATVGAALGGVVAQAGGLAAPFWLAFAAMVPVTVAAWRPLRHTAPSQDPAGQPSGGDHHLSR